MWLKTKQYVTELHSSAIQPHFQTVQSQWQMFILWIEPQGRVTILFSQLIAVSQLLHANVHSWYTLSTVPRLIVSYWWHKRFLPKEDTKPIEDTKPKEDTKMKKFKDFLRLAYIKCRYGNRKDTILIYFDMNIFHKLHMEYIWRHTNTNPGNRKEAYELMFRVISLKLTP